MSPNHKAFLALNQILQTYLTRKAMYETALSQAPKGTFESGYRAGQLETIDIVIQDIDAIMARIRDGLTLTQNEDEE
jgi:hypothetical protein